MVARSRFASHTTQVVELLMVGAWINGIAFIPYSLLQGQGRPDTVAKLHALELPPYAIALWLLLSSFGLPGAAIAWCGRVAIDAAVLFKLARLRSHQLIRLIPALGLVLTSYLIAHSSTSSALYRIIFAGVVFFAFLGCAIALDATSRKLLQTLGQRLASATDMIAANARTRPRKMNLSMLLRAKPALDWPPRRARSVQHTGDAPIAIGPSIVHKAPNQSQKLVVRGLPVVSALPCRAGARSIKVERAMLSVSQMVLIGNRPSGLSTTVAATSVFLPVWRRAPPSVSRPPGCRFSKTRRI